MAEQRQFQFDLLALLLLAGCVFLTLALATYNPSDPVPELIAPLDRWHTPDLLVYPAATTPHNLCGRWGALAADLLFKLLGLGAYYLVGSLIVVDVTMLLRRPITAPIVRLLGWVLSLVALTTLVAMFLPAWSPGPVIGAGGYLGALGRGLLETHFATVGGAILAVSLLMGGLFLATDYTIVTLAMTAWAVAYSVLARVRLVRPETVATDVEELVAEEEADEGPTILPVRISGKRLAAAEVADDLEEDLEEDLDESAEDETPEEDEAATIPFRTPATAAEDQAEAPPPVESPAASTHAVKPAETMKVRKPAAKSEREEMMAALDQASKRDGESEFQLPPIDLLLQGDDFCFDEQEKEVRRKAKILEKTFGNFGFNVKVVEIETGPVIAQYEVELEAGLRLSKISGLADDLAIALRVPSVRIVAPIPGKNTVGIEVPNSQRQVVRLREVMEETNGRIKKMEIPLFVGKDVSGKPLTVDLAKLPHLLIAGRTGTGKSVCLNAIIASMLMTRRPDEVRMLMIDPKMVELSGYKTLPHLMHPVVTDMRKAEAILAWAVEKMEERYALLARAGVRHVTSYNQLSDEELMERLQPENDDERAAIPRHLPYIVIVADEMADLMMTAGKEVEQHIIRLAQKSRAVGIHLILATQKPTVDVVTGLIKSNLPARIAFQVASRTDSRVVLDEMGADKLLGNGDMLFLLPGTSTLVRGQGTYLSDDELNKIVEFVSTGEQEFVAELVQLKPKAQEGEQPAGLKNRDELYEAAVDVVVREGRGSVSLLQRALGIGYGRAARLIDFMAEDGIVGNYAGSQAREVQITLEQWEAMQAGNQAASGSGPVIAPAPSPPPMKPNPPAPSKAAGGPSAAKPPSLPAVEILETTGPKRSNKVVLAKKKSIEEENDAPIADDAFEDRDERDLDDADDFGFREREVMDDEDGEEAFAAEDDAEEFDRGDDPADAFDDGEVDEEDVDEEEAVADDQDSGAADDDPEAEDSGADLWAARDDDRWDDDDAADERPASRRNEQAESNATRSTDEPPGMRRRAIPFRPTKTHSGHAALGSHDDEDEEDDPSPPEDESLAALRRRNRARLAKRGRMRE